MVQIKTTVKSRNPLSAFIDHWKSLSCNMDEKADTIVNDLPDPDLKIILLGDSAVGKSKLIERYLMNDYNPRQVF